MMEGSQRSKAASKKALIASLIGSSIEFYDYLLYGIVASLVFNKIFFPTFDPVVGQLIVLASFGIPFFFRPLGGIVFSHIGDKIGRKKTLVLTLWLMGGSTAIIGLLPDYGTIGIWAPIMLVSLRLIQGFAIGGEWGGAVLLAVEYSSKESKGFGGSVPMMGAAVGMLLGTFSVSIMGLLPDDQFLAWGWRIPFILSFGLLFVGLWIRSGLDETPEYQEAKASGTIPNLPIVETMRHHWKLVLVTVGAKAVETAPFYIFATFIITYATNNLGLDKLSVLNAVTIGTLFSIIIIPAVGKLSDRLGRKFLFILGTTGVIMYAFPYFYLLSFGSVFLLTIATIIGMGLWAIITAVIGTLFSEMFETRIRYTGISVGYQIGAALAGGTAPLVAAALIGVFNGSWIPVAVYLMGIGFISLISISFIQDKTFQKVDLHFEVKEVNTLQKTS